MSATELQACYARAAAASAAEARAEAANLRGDCHGKAASQVTGHSVRGSPEGSFKGRQARLARRTAGPLAYCCDTACAS